MEDASGDKEADQANEYVQKNSWGDTKEIINNDQINKHPEPKEQDWKERSKKARKMRFKLEAQQLNPAVFLHALLK